MDTLTVVTVSREPEKVSALGDSLAHGLGWYSDSRAYDFDLIVVDGNEFDLFAGYDEGIRRAKANPHHAPERFLFTHDDVRFWGNKLCFDRPWALLAKPFTGFIGAAGSTVMPAHGCWWQVDQSRLRGAVAHPGANLFDLHWNVWPWGGGQFGPVAVCDGVWLMASLGTLETIGGFDTGYLSGFHFYDLDATLRAHLAGLTNYVAPFPLVHGSPGVPDAGWDANRKKFVARYQGVLPVGA